MAVDCLAGYLYTAKMDNEKFPKASKLSDINIDRLSDELDITGTYTDAFTNMVSVDVKAYAKEHFDKIGPKNPYHSGLAKYCCAGRGN